MINRKCCLLTRVGNITFSQIFCVLIRFAPGLASTDREAVCGGGAQSTGGGSGLEASRTAGSGAAGLGSVSAGPVTTSTGRRYLHSDPFHSLACC